MNRREYMYLDYEFYYNGTEYVCPALKLRAIRYHDMLEALEEAERNEYFFTPDRLVMMALTIVPVAIALVLLVISGLLNK